MEPTRGNLNRLLLTLERALGFGLEAEGTTVEAIERELNEAIVMVKAMKTAANRNERKTAYESKIRDHRQAWQP